MSIGRWDPAAAQENFAIDMAALKKYINMSQQNRLTNLGEQLPVDEQQQQAPLMQQGQTAWFTAVQSLKNTELVDLIRFFTVAESLPGWQAGQTSPVIWLSKVLKQRGVSMSRELLLWIKANSDNRFLPYGSL